MNNLFKKDSFNFFGKSRTNIEALFADQGYRYVVANNIIVGDDVLIAHNTYMSCDVPSRSTVIGSPCKIMPREGVSGGYIVNRVEC